MYNRERYTNTWEPLVPIASRLTDDDVTQFVNGMTTVAFLAMFSKTGINESAAAIQSLATLRPELIIPSVLEKFVKYNSFQNLFLQKVDTDFILCDHVSSVSQVLQCLYYNFCLTQVLRIGFYYML